MVDLLGLPWMRGGFTKKEQFIEKWEDVIRKEVDAEYRKQLEDAKKDNSNDEEAMNIDFSVKPERTRGAPLTGAAGIEIDETWANADGRAFKPYKRPHVGRLNLKFTVIGSAINIMARLKHIFALFDGEEAGED